MFFCDVGGSWEERCVVLGERVVGRIIVRKVGEEVMVMVELSYEIVRRGCSRGVV